MARDGGRARDAGSGARRRSDRGDRSQRPDARARRPRQCGHGHPPGDPLERPAHRRRVRRDRGAHRPRTADRPDRESRAHRVHGAEAPLAATQRAGRLPPDRADHAAQGLRPTQAHGRVGHRRRRRVGDPAPRRCRPHLVERGARRPRAAGRMAAALSSSRPRSPASRSPAAPSRQGFRSLQGRATARPPRSASGSTGPGRSRS